MLTPGERPAGTGWASVLHGGTSIADRREVLDRLDGPASQWGVVSNCRVLGEGVDVPTLDAIAMCDPRSSDLEIAQAVGRVLRTSSAKTHGTVIVPVLTDDRLDLGVASGVLRALRAHDDRLGGVLDALRREKHRWHGTETTAEAAERKRALRARLAQHLELHLPGSAVRALTEAIQLTLVDAASSSWEESYGLLERWVAETGSARVPQAAVVPVGESSFGLGSWCSTQRARYRAGKLPLEYEAMLEALPGWEWDPLDAQFRSQLAALVAWAEAHDTTPGACPMRAVHDGVRVGQFVNVVRGAYRDHSLPEVKVAALEALDGWVWNVRDAAWWEHHALLAAWTAAHGHARPSANTFIDGFDLGRWVAKQRAKLRGGALDAEQCAALRALPGWSDEVRAEPWWAAYAALERYIAQHGQLPAQSVRYANLRLGSWVAKQRARYQQGRLDPERITALEALPGWWWSSERDAFGEGLAALDAYIARAGDARVPDGYRDADGYPLGAWVGFQRQRGRAGQLSALQREALEARAGWCWSVHEQRFADGVARLERFVTVHGRLPGPGETFEGERLGLWAKNRRDDHRRGRLKPERAARLEAVAQWCWEG